jgi:hypothetical protein
VAHDDRFLDRPIADRVLVDDPLGDGLVGRAVRAPLGGDARNAVELAAVARFALFRSHDRPELLERRRAV